MHILLPPFLCFGSMDETPLQPAVGTASIAGSAPHEGAEADVHHADADTRAANVAPLNLNVETSDETHISDEAHATELAGNHRKSAGPTEVRQHCVALPRTCPPTYPLTH